MIHSLFSDSDCVYLVVAGDFNCKLDSKFYYVFCKFLIDQQLICQFAPVAWHTHIH